jgi:hypothetical protein
VGDEWRLCRASWSTDCVVFRVLLAPGVDLFGAPFFLLLLAIPGYYGALLLLGLPRVLIFCHDDKPQERA